MPVCEKCWAEYQLRQQSDPHVTYAEVLAEHPEHADVLTETMLPADALTPKEPNP